jgi:hypothetical protein
VTSDPGAQPATSQAQDTSPESTQPPRKRRGWVKWVALIVGVLVLDFVAMTIVPPFPKGGVAGDACDFPTCFITSSIEFPPPAVVIDLQPDTAPAAAPMIYFHPSISSTILTMWIVMALLLVVAFAATRRMRLGPGAVQNLVEWAYEFGRDFAIGIGG